MVQLIVGVVNAERVLLGGDVVAKNEVEFKLAAALSCDIHSADVEEIRACRRKRGVLLECKEALTEV